MTNKTQLSLSSLTQNVPVKVSVHASEPHSSLSDAVLVSVDVLVVSAIYVLARVSVFDNAVPQ